MNLYIFDYDQTLAPPIQAPTEQLLFQAARILEKDYFVIISGGRGFDELENLFVKKLSSVVNTNLRNLFICPSYGNLIYGYDKGASLIRKSNPIEEEKKNTLFKVAQKLVWREYSINEIYGEQILDKEFYVSIECLGEQAPKEVKEKWDIDKGKRKKIKEKILSQLTISWDIYITGRNSIDFVPENLNKANNIKILSKLLNVDLNHVEFTGNEFDTDGNDFSVLNLGIKVNKVNSPEETLALMMNI